MPALDQYQPTVVNALRKAGWQVYDMPHIIRVDKRLLMVDLTAKRDNDDLPEQIIIVEVKGFEDRSVLHSLEEAVGQYVVYRALLEELKVTSPLYLAVPRAAYEGILSEQVGRIVRKRLSVKMIVFDVSSEEIVEWLD